MTGNAQQHQRVYNWANGLVRDWVSRGRPWNSRPRFKYLDMDESFAAPVKQALENHGEDWTNFRKVTKRAGFGKQPSHKKFGKVDKPATKWPRMGLEGELRQSKMATMNACFVCGNQFGEEDKILRNKEYSVPGIPLRVHKECAPNLEQMIRSYTKSAS